MGAKSVIKGATAEREFAKTLGELIDLPDSLCRNLEQRRSGGDDLTTRSDPDKPASTIERKLLGRLNEFSIEIKRHAKAKPAAVSSWWQQATEQSRDYDPFRQPMLAYRADREPWRCVLHVSQELPLDDIRGCLVMDVQLFAEFLRRGLPHVQH